MTAAFSVVKIGGSLMSDVARLRTVLEGLAAGTEGMAVVVPGGGPFATAVRTAQAALGFGDTLAHRLALDAMGHLAEVFSELEPRLPIASDEDQIRATLADGRSVIWDPVALRAGRPDIPESWDVTSDSLALWLAARLGARRCLLHKSAPCPAGSQPSELAQFGMVDRAFPQLAQAFAGDIVLHGPDGPTAVARDARDIRAAPSGPHLWVRHRLAPPDSGAGRTDRGPRGAARDGAA